MKNTIFKLLVILTFGFCCCSESFNPPKYIDDFSKNFIKIIQNESLDSILTFINKDTQNQNAKELFSNLSEQLKYKQLNSIKILGFNKTSYWATNQENSTIYKIDYEYKFDNLYYLFSISIIEINNKLAIVGFNSNVFDRPIEEVNGFSLSTIGIPHLLFVIFMILIFGFIIFTIVDIAKTKIKRKWLWFIISLIGFCGLSMNWSTGDMSFKFFIFKLLGIGFSKSGIISPWFISLSVPIGSIIYWIKKPGILYDQELEISVKELKENKK